MLSANKLVKKGFSDKLPPSIAFSLEVYPPNALKEHAFCQHALGVFCSEHTFGYEKPIL